MNYLPMSPSDYAYRVYELLACIQAGEDLAYDGDRTISVAGLQAEFHWQGTEITFPDPYSDEPATVCLGKAQMPSAVASVVEALLTTFALHLAAVAAENVKTAAEKAAEARLLQEVD